MKSKVKPFNLVCKSLFAILSGTYFFGFGYIFISLQNLSSSFFLSFYYGLWFRTEILIFHRMPGIKWYDQTRRRKKIRLSFIQIAKGNIGNMGLLSEWNKQNKLDSRKFLLAKTVLCIKVLQVFCLSRTERGMNIFLFAIVLLIFLKRLFTPKNINKNIINN